MTDDLQRWGLPMGVAPAAAPRQPVVIGGVAAAREPMAERLPGLTLMSAHQWVRTWRVDATRRPISQ